MDKKSILAAFKRFWNNVVNYVNTKTTWQSF